MYEALWRRMGLSFDWSYQYTTIGDVARTAAQRAFLRNLARGEAYSAQAPSLWDADVRHRGGPGRAGGPRACPVRTTGSGSPARDGRPLEVDTTRPELLPACVALVCHPTDARYAALVGVARTPRVRSRGADLRASVGRPGQGHRSGDGLHLRRSDRRDLVARPAAGHPGRARAATVGCWPIHRPVWTLPPTRRSPACTVKPGAGPDRGAAPGAGRAGRRAPADHPPGEVLREGRPAAGDREHPPVVHPQRRPRRRPARGPAGARSAAAVGARPHAPPVRALGGRADRRLADQPAALLRRAVPGVVPAGRARRAGLRAPADTGRAGPAGRPVLGRPGRASPRRSAASRAASSATRTSWTPGPPPR